MYAEREAVALREAGPLRPLPKEVLWLPFDEQYFARRRKARPVRVRQVTPGTFTALQAAWDARLREAGFVDIENRQTGQLSNVNNPSHLGQWDTVKCAAIASYYRRARSFLHAYAFPNWGERELWRHHSDGHGYKFAARELGIRNWDAGQIIRRLKSEMLRLCNDSDTDDEIA